MIERGTTRVRVSLASFMAVELMFGANGTGPTPEATELLEVESLTLLVFFAAISRAGRGRGCGKSGAAVVEPNRALNPDDMD